ncbi:glycosyltransferase, partial [Candidatus Pelagibacter sp.]|nr:glycosyltransferase [Candidatus Pelagibacter sp.]
FLRLNKKIKVILSMQNHLPAIFLAVIFRKKIIIRNSEEIFGATKYADHKISAYIILLLKLFFYSFSDCIIAISNKSKLSLERLGINKIKIRLIYNPFIKKIIKNKNKNYVYGKPFNIISVGRLTRQKNFDNLINMISALQKKYPFINFKIIGNGPDYKSLKFKISGNKKISIIQWKKNLHKYYDESHLFVLNSYYEGLPNILIEAINNNVPCVATDCSGTQDILMNNKGGFIVPVADSDAMINKIKYIIKNYKNSVHRTKISKKYIFRFDQKNCNKYYTLLKKYI